MFELAAGAAHAQAIHMIPILMESLVSLILPVFIILTIFVVFLWLFFLGKYIITKCFYFIDRA